MKWTEAERRGCLEALRAAAASLAAARERAAGMVIEEDLIYQAQEEIYKTLLGVAQTIEELNDVIEPEPPALARPAWLPVRK